MYSFKITAYVNGTRTETIIQAYSRDDAEKLFRAQYSMCNISSFSCTRL